MVNFNQLNEVLSYYQNQLFLAPSTLIGKHLYPHDCESTGSLENGHILFSFVVYF